MVIKKNDDSKNFIKSIRVILVSTWNVRYLDNIIPISGILWIWLKNDT